MRVCYIVNEATVTAGWGRYAVEVIKGTLALGIESVLVTASPKIDLALAHLEHHPLLIPVLSRRLNTLQTFQHSPVLRRMFKTCDLVHCMTELYAPMVAFASPKPWVLNAHGTWGVRPLENRGMRLFFAPAFRRADRIICLSQFTYDWMNRLMPLSNAEVLTGGVRVSEYDRSVEMTFPDWSKNKPIIFTPAAFKTRKGQHVMLEALALVRQKIPDVQWVLAGNDHANPEFVSRLKTRIRELGLENQVHFLGIIPQDDLVAWYQRADLCAVTQVNDGSTFEGLGMIFLEAGAVYTPSIGSRNCGAEAAIIDGVSGFLTPQNDPEAIAEALLKILSDKTLAQKMGQAARQQAEKLSWENLCRRTVEIYDEVLG